MRLSRRDIKNAYHMWVLDVRHYNALPRFFHISAGVYLSGFLIAMEPLWQIDSV